VPPRGSGDSEPEVKASVFIESH
jgi:ribonuclease HI